VVRTAAERLGMITFAAAIGQSAVAIGFTVARAELPATARNLLIVGIVLSILLFREAQMKMATHEILEKHRAFLVELWRQVEATEQQIVASREALADMQAKLTLLENLHSARALLDDLRSARGSDL
jgi:hypothetical protein